MERLFRLSQRCTIKLYIYICTTVFSLIAATPSVHAAQTDDVLTTFDPYGASDEPAVTEDDALEELRPFLFFTTAYSFTYRNGFEDTDAHEENHMWTFGATYSPWSFLFVGISAPVLRTRFIAPESDDTYSSFEGAGFGDLATYVGGELPWFPLTLTGMLMWPTGNRKKGLGTGEFSGGFLADIRYAFGIVDLKAGGFYFLVDDPPDISLPNTYGASIGVGVRPLKWFHICVGAGWSYLTLITNKSVHQFDANVRATFTATKWLSATVGFAAEYYPVHSYTPSLTLTFNI